VEPKTGKHDVQPIAKTMAPREPIFSDIAVSFMYSLFYA